MKSDIKKAKECDNSELERKAKLFDIGAEAAIETWLKGKFKNIIKENK